MNVILSRMKKILLIMLLASVVSFNPGAVEKNNSIAEKLVPGNVRLSNSYSSGKDFAGAERAATAARETGEQG